MKNAGIEERRFAGGCGVGLRRVVGGVLVFSLAALLLNAEALRRDAELMEYGLLRNLCLDLITPVYVLSDSLGVDTLRGLVEKFSL